MTTEGSVVKTVKLKQPDLLLSGKLREDHETLGASISNQFSVIYCTLTRLLSMFKVK